MDFIEGETLEDAIARRAGQRYTLNEVLEVGLQLCSVLDYLHTRQPPIIFRDLKPANIMCTPAGHLYLIDFGIARHFKPGQSKDTMPLGSPGYAAPEQYGKAQTTQRSDIYSLGALLHFLLSGQDPSEQPFLLQPLPGNGSGERAELERLVARMVALNPVKRPASVAEVQEDLHALAASVQGNRNGLLPQRLLRPEWPPPSYAVEQERFGVGQEQVQEQIFSPEVRPSRRGFVIGGLLVGAALVTGAGGLLALSSRSRAPVVRPVPATATSQAVATPQSVTGPFSPDAMFGLDAQHTRFNPHEHILSPANVSRLALSWRSLALGRNYFSSPVVTGGSIYLGNADGLLFALDAANGQIRWQSSGMSRAGYSTPAVSNGRVYMCLGDAGLFAFAASDGRLLWKTTMQESLNASPVAANGVVYITSATSVYAVDALSGRIRWTSAVNNTNQSPPAVANGLLYIITGGTGAGASRLCTLDLATGERRWTSDLINQDGVDPNSSPTVANGLVYIGTGRGGLAAFDAATGRTRWITAAQQGSTGCSPAVAQGLVYLAVDRVFAFDALSGAIRWVSEPVGAYNSDSPLVANGVLYVGSAGNDNGGHLGSVYALDALGGQILWISPQTQGQIFTTPAVVDGVVYVASGDSDGAVYTYHLPS